MTSTLLENFSRMHNGIASMTHYLNFKIILTIMNHIMITKMTLQVELSTSFPEFSQVLFDMETGRVIWTTVPEMGDKVRPCVVICSLNADRFFYVPLSTVDYNTLWQVPLKFKGKNAYADLRRCFTGQKPGYTHQRVSTDCLNDLLNSLNHRMEALWASFIAHGVTVA